MTSTNPQERFRRAIIDGDAAALLAEAHEIARQLGQTDLSKTQMRAVYSAVRRLDRAQNPAEVQAALPLVLARLAYLTQLSQNSYQLRGSREAIAYLQRQVEQANRLIRDASGETLVERARALVELFQATLAYQGLERARLTQVRNPLTSAEQDELRRVIQQGDGAAIFEIAQRLVQGQRNLLDLSKTQLRNVFGTLKNLQSTELNPKTRLQLRLLEPRLLYALSRDPGLEKLVRVLYQALQVLHENGAPSQKAFDNFVKLAESIVAVQVHARANLRTTTPTEAANSLRQAIKQNNGQALTELSRQVAGQMAGQNLSRGQVRNLYDTVRRLETGGFKDDESLAELQRLRATLRYAMGREPRLEPLFGALETALVTVFEATDEKIQQQRARWLADFFEAIVAWQTVYRARRDGPAKTDLSKEDAELLTKALNGDDTAAANLAEKVAGRVRAPQGQGKALSRGQLRTVFSILKQEAGLARSISLARFTTLSLPDLKRRLWLIVPRLEYAAAREPSLEALKQVARAGLTQILTQADPETNPVGALAKRLEYLADLLEGIVAFYTIQE